MASRPVSKIFTDPHIGPILIIILLLIILLTQYIPNVTQVNLNNTIKQKAIVEMEFLQTLRSYYTRHIVKVVEKETDLEINFDYRDKQRTIPLPATLIHDFNNILSDKNKKIKLYSNYPFPNRKNRVLKDYEKEALSYLINNPNETFTKIIKENGSKYMVVSTADIMYDNTCVNCHNTRFDSPKTDWKLGDTRGVLQVTIPYNKLFLLTEKQSMFIFYSMIFVVFILTIHYTVLAIRRQKEHKKSQKKLENLVSQRTASLENSNKLLSEYKKAFDKTAIVSKTDTMGIITYVNDAFCNISGYRKEELLGQNHNIIRHPSTPKSTFQEMWETIKAKKIWNGIIKNKTKDGGYYYVESTIIPILDNNEEIQEFIAVRIDVTKLVESKLKIEEANKAKSTFLANMSHEIRTPMNAIIGFSQVLATSKELSEQNHKHASIIETSAKSLLSIINDILDVSKIESGTFDVNYAKTNLPSSCNYIYNLFQHKAKEKNIDFIIDFDKKIPETVLLDEIRLKQVLSNLINNSLKFTPEFGSVSLKVEVLSSNSKDIDIRFSVKDTGIGIPIDKITNIFEPFMQVDNKSNKKYEGTGLGLSICSHIIESFNSKINVQSSLGSGTTFWFDLNLEIIKDNTKKVIKNDFNNNINTFNGNVLVAEDNSANQELIKYILESFGLKYTITSNGQEALDFYKQNYEMIDLILMDINMPILDGIEAFMKITDFEKNGCLKHTPICALTANTIKGDKEKFLALGMDYYISKPINKDALKEFFLKYLDDSKKNIKSNKDSSDKENSKISASKIANCLGVSEDIAFKLIDKFKNDIQKDLNELKDLIEEKNTEAISQKAHYIKNSCMNIKLDRAINILQEIETNKKLSKKELDSLYEKLTNLIQESIS